MAGPTRIGQGRRPGLRITAGMAVMVSGERVVSASSVGERGQGDAVLRSWCRCFSPVLAGARMNGWVAVCDRRLRSRPFV